jgi:hypothetical protein
MKMRWCWRRRSLLLMRRRSWRIMEVLAVLARVESRLSVGFPCMAIGH